MAEETSWHGESEESNYGTIVPRQLHSRLLILSSIFHVPCFKHHLISVRAYHGTDVKVALSLFHNCPSCNLRESTVSLSLR